MNLKYYLLFFLITLALLVLRFISYYTNLPVFKSGQEVIINSVVSDEPELMGKQQKFRLNPKGLNFTIITGKTPLYKFGDQLHIEGWIKVFNDGRRNFYSFSYPKITDTGSSKNPLKRASLYIRRRADVIYAKYLTPTQSALLLGIVFGIKQNMPDQFYEVLRDAGVVHVIAASGMNVSMVAGALFYTFQRFLNRKLAIIFSLCGILLYLMIAGFEASIVRASIMAGITFSAGLAGRQKMTLFALFQTASVMLFIKPFWITDLGFQLSFVATLGILLVKPILDSFLKVGSLGIIGEDLTTTLSAQITTLPILVINFGSFNLMSVIVNLLILWTIPFIMIIGGISILMGLFFTQIGSFLSVFAVPLLMYFEILVTWFDRYKLTLSIADSGFLLWSGYYLILISIIYLLKRNVKIKK